MSCTRSPRNNEVSNIEPNKDLNTKILSWDGVPVDVLDLCPIVVFVCISSIVSNETVIIGSRISPVQSLSTIQNHLNTNRSLPFPFPLLSPPAIHTPARSEGAPARFSVTSSHQAVPVGIHDMEVSRCEPSTRTQEREAASMPALTWHNAAGVEPRSSGPWRLIRRQARRRLWNDHCQGSLSCRRS